MHGVDVDSFFVIFAVATLAAGIAAVAAPKFFVPVVVLEAIFGILIGPQVLDVAKTSPFIDFFATGGLGLLFFFAGYEIDFERIKGAPLRLAVLGWGMTLALSYGAGALLAAAGVIVSGLYTGTAMSTTAVGTLLPILSDNGETKTRFGSLILAAGAVGEFGPILLVTLLFSGSRPLEQALVLGAFALITVVAALVAMRGTAVGWQVFDRSLKTSGQGAVRLVVLLVISLVALAESFGLELLLGGFVSGIIVRSALRGRDVEEFESKLTAIGYGFFIPFFFVVSGMKFDINALTGSPQGMLKLPLFYALFLAVRGLPALLLYREEIGLRDRAALGFYSATQLPLVVAITTIAVAEGEMRVSTSSALVGAAILSTATFPLIAMALRRGNGDAAATPTGTHPAPSAAA